MKSYGDGMVQVVQTFETLHQQGTPEHVLDDLSQWVEDVLPCYLRRTRKGGDQLEQVFLCTDRLIPALKRRVKQMGFGAVMLLCALTTSCAAPQKTERPITGRVMVKGNFGVDVVTEDGREVMVMLPHGMVIETRQDGGFKHVTPAREEPSTLPTLQARHTDKDRAPEWVRGVEMPTVQPSHCGPATTATTQPNGDH